jgi:hypothetical protein
LIDFSQEEAYILGCLYGRGSLEQEKIILRFPHVAYDPIGRAIIRTLLDKKRGLSVEELYNIPSVKRENINIKLKLARLRRWHPPRVETMSPLLEHENDVWRIHDMALADEYLKWQDIYLQRENAWKDYVIKNIKETFSFMASYTEISERIDKFGHRTLIVECKVQDIAIHYLKNTYNMDIGDVYVHNTFSDSNTIFERYDKTLKEFFIRGLADTIATLDRYISRDKPCYRVQFSVINANTKLPIDMCLLFQKHLQIPVYYIGWAALENEARDEAYARRGKRDHLVKIWVLNFKNKFNLPLFMNRAKDEEFLQALEASEKCSIGQNRLDFCPRGRKKQKYMEICIKQGCKQVKELP